MWWKGRKGRKYQVSSKGLGLVGGEEERGKREVRGQGKSSVREDGRGWWVGRGRGWRGGNKRKELIRLMYLLSSSQGLPSH